MTGVYSSDPRSISTLSNVILPSDLREVSLLVPKFIFYRLPPPNLTKSLLDIVLCYSSIFWLLFPPIFFTTLSKLTVFLRLSGKHGVAGTPAKLSLLTTLMPFFNLGVNTN